VSRTDLKRPERELQRRCSTRYCDCMAAADKRGDRMLEPLDQSALH
jgi:hypothetical protein